MLKTITEHANVTAALKQAALVYPRTWDGYEALCWILCRNERLALPIKRNPGLYYIHKQAAYPPLVPQFKIIYQISETTIDILSIKVG